MNRVGEAAFAVLSAAWAGALWTVGYLVAPMLFARLDDRAQAGQIAGWMFSAAGVVGIACGVGLIALLLARRRQAALRDGLFWVIAVMLALTLVQRFGLQPLMQDLKGAAGGGDVMQGALRDRFATWHGISSAVYLLQSLLAVALVALQRRFGQ